MYRGPVHAGLERGGFHPHRTIQGFCRHFVVHTGVVDTALEFDIVAFGLSERDIPLKPIDLEHLLSRVREIIHVSRHARGLSGL